MMRKSLAVAVMAVVLTLVQEMDGLSLDCDQTNCATRILDELEIIFEQEEEEPAPRKLATFSAKGGPEMEVKLSVSSRNSLTKIALNNSRTTTEGIDFDVITIKKLDREDGVIIMFEVSAVEGAFSVTATGAILLQDINDSPPTFSQDQYPAEVEETTSVDATLAIIQVTDADSGNNRKMDITISGGNEEGFFKLDGTKIKLAKKGLDRESGTQTFNLTITATDRGFDPLSADSFVFLTVKDVNDHDPVFSAEVYNGTVEEEGNGKTVSVVLNATDLDPDVGTLLYTITGGNDEKKFKVDSKSGDITTTEALDREGGDDQFQLKVTVSDGLGKTDTATVNILVSNINDNTPQFDDEEYTVSIPEDAKVGDTLLIANATDKDEMYTSVSQLRYSIVQSETLPRSFAAFKIPDATVGKIVVKGALEYDTATAGDRTHVMTILVQDEDGNSDDASVRITVTDVNDQPPVFSGKTSDTQEIRESEEPGDFTYVVPEATDTEKGVNGEVAYRLNAIKDAGGGFTDAKAAIFFTFNNDTRVITHARQFDRSLADTFTILVDAYDKGTPSLSATFTLNVIVTEPFYNDDAPVFGQGSYNFTLNENMGLSKLGAVNATDPDRLNISYAIECLLQTCGSSKDLFIISENGTITATEDLDFESKVEHVLRVTATDTHPDDPKSTSVLVKVKVEDVNDSPPVLAKNEYTVTIPEGSTGVFSTIEASDADSTAEFTTDDMRFYFSVKSENGPSRISVSPKDAARLSVGSDGVDFEATDFDSVSKVDGKSVKAYTMTLMVFAISGAGQDEATLIVKVTDVNDNAPKFDKLSGSITISDSASRGDVLFSPRATDADEGENAALVYSIVSGNFSEYFKISENKVVADKKFDASMQSSMAVIIRVSDKGSPKKTSEDNGDFSLNVTLRRGNYKAPVFDTSSPFVKYFYENTSVGFTLFELAATDADATAPNNEFVLSLDESTNSAGMFKFNSSTGLISLAKELNYETTIAYVLKVTATDQAIKEDERKSTPVLLTILVLDTNDHKPKLDLREGTEVSIDENTAAGTSLFIARATDADATDAHSTLSYFVTAQSPTTFVKINKTSGEALLEIEIDYEVDPRNYTCTVIVTDGIYSDEATYTITIDDINDSPPKFNVTEVNVTVLEDLSTGTAVASFFATDADAGANSVIDYSLVVNEGSKFRISGNKIVTKAGFDYEENVTQFRAVVVAKDRGNPALSTALNESFALLLTVRDVNDCPPVLAISSSVVEVPETLAVNVSLVTVMATDADKTAPNNKLRYSLIKSTTSDLFQVDAKTGVVSSKGELDYEKTDKHVVRIQVEDQANETTDQRLSETYTLTVKVFNVIENAEAPQFTNGKPLQLKMFETTKYRSVGEIHAKDADPVADGSGVVTYAITGQSTAGAFVVNATSGTISSAASLCLKDVATFEHTINITATDHPVGDDLVCKLQCLWYVRQKKRFGRDAVSLLSWLRDCPRDGASFAKLLH
jgi:hypothetical protein